MVVNRRCANGRINHWCGPDDDRRGLINDRRLGVNHGGLRVNDSRLLLHHDLRCGLINDLRGLLDHDGLLNYDRCRFCINRPRLECRGDQQARSHACHDFSSGCPFLVARVGPCDRTSENSQRCCYH